MYEIRIGEEVYEAIGLVNHQPGGGAASESYITREGKCVLLRWYETWDSALTSPNYESFRDTIRENRVIRVNGVEYVHLEDRVYR